MMSKQQKDKITRLNKEKMAFKYNLADDTKQIDVEGYDTWKFSLQCDSKTPYSSDKVYLTFKIPPKYPLEQPQVWVQSPNRFMHPNIEQDGKVCYIGQERPGLALHIADRINIIRQLLEKPNPLDSYSLQYAEKVLEKYNEWFVQSQKKFKSTK